MMDNKNNKNMTKNDVTLYAPDIECDGCARSIQAAVGTLTGVEAIDVDVAAKTVRVLADNAVSTGAILAAMDKAGFSAELLPAR